jgi:hypothetical protein
MRIATVGNCQTKALTWYIQRLNSEFDVKFICMNNRWAWCRQQYQPKRATRRGEYTPTLTDRVESIDFLKSVDVIVYQHIKPKTSKYYNYEKIPEYAKADCKLISISSFVYNKDNPEYLRIMKEKADDFKISIPAHKLIEKHGDKIKSGDYDDNHPNTFYFLEVMREICKLTKWNFYSSKEYEFLLERKHPFNS